ncbi:hypothetical protein DRP05_07395 [Archaeoglobales archaeon]|nr:MAG: hypothetical protein DRP05_07395 [Archaeoglobales archaeon]
MKINEFFSFTYNKIEKEGDKNEINLENVKKIVDLSAEFHKKAKIPAKNCKIDEDSLILESGHQPNFFPYSGIWRKVFLLDYFTEMFREKTIPIFGFFDFNLSTAKWLFQNRIPAVNKNGFVTIGFTKPRNLDMWRRFNSIEKPSEKKWEKEINKIYNIYGKNEKVEEIAEEIWKSYELGDTLSDVNAILFARLSSKLGFNVLFFRYSDVQKSKLFVDEWRKIIDKVELFNKIHNEVVESKNLGDIGFVDINSAPFWYHCECGGKVQMHLNGSFNGECLVCGKSYEFDDNEIEEEFKNLSPKAVMRNTVFAEGLRTTVFIAGSGGGLRYGLISNEVAKRFGFNIPITLAWSGRDYYLGKAHKIVLKELERNLKVGIDDLFDYDIALSKVKKRRFQLAKAISSSDEKRRGQYVYSETLLSIANNVFSTTPSMLDLLASGYDVVEVWQKTIVDAEIENKEFCIIKKDVVYGDENLPKLYDAIKRLKNRSKEIDPLNIL